MQFGKGSYRRMLDVHVNEYGCLLGCCAVEYFRRLPTFQRRMLPPPSGHNPFIRQRRSKAQNIVVYVLAAARNCNL
jgi:hypothetical protein